METKIALDVFADFIGTISYLSPLCVPENLKKLFEKYDKDHNSFIEGKELEPIGGFYFVKGLFKGNDEEIRKLWENEEKMLKESLKQVMDEYDKNKDKKISIDEFKQLMLDVERRSLKSRGCSVKTFKSIINIIKEFKEKVSIDDVKKGNKDIQHSSFYKIFETDPSVLKSALGDDIRLSCFNICCLNKIVFSSFENENEDLPKFFENLDKDAIENWEKYYLEIQTLIDTLDKMYLLYEELIKK